MSEQLKAFQMVIGAIKRKDEGKPPPRATCPACSEPLIMTFRFPGKEFVCVECRKLWGFVEPVPAEETPELKKRYDELKTKWDLELEQAKGKKDETD